MAFEHRAPGYALLGGQGIEIGAFHHPAPLPPGCQVAYCDALHREEAAKFFPEVKVEDLVEVTHLCDLDQDGLNIFSANQFDFVILNHVIEHVANPIRVVGELFRVVRAGGRVVLSAPDKRFCFDAPRGLTPFEHVLEEYQNHTTTITDAHYRDFLVNVHPELNFDQLPAEAQQGHLQNMRNRREHAHVWDSESFADFVQRSLGVLQFQATCIFLHSGDANQFEYFSVWQKS